LPVDVYGSSGTTTTFDVARGIVSAVNNGANVLNMSLGGQGDSPFLDELITQVRQQGVMVFAAAGNEPTTLPTWPAAHPDVIAVTAADRKGNVAPYANRGAFVDLLAPGTSKVQFNNQSFYVSGTSTATAFVSGVAAAHAASGKTEAQIHYYLQHAFPMRTDAAAPVGAPQPPR
jgi:thermitase